MAIVLNGTTGITTPDIDSTAGFDAADITGTISTAQIADANVTQAKLAGEAVNESKLQVSNAPTSIFRNDTANVNYDNTSWDDAGLPNPVSMSGTWRAMTHAPVISTRGLTALWVRIS